MDAMSVWKRLKSSLRSARDPDSLDMVEQVMEDEERQRGNGNSGVARLAWTCKCSFASDPGLVSFVSVACKSIREGIGECNGNGHNDGSALQELH
jgi:hypothetical protein